MSRRFSRNVLLSFVLIYPIFASNFLNCTCYTGDFCKTCLQDLNAYPYPNIDSLETTANEPEETIQDAAQVISPEGDKEKLIENLKKLTACFKCGSILPENMLVFSKQNRFCLLCTFEDLSRFFSAYDLSYIEKICAKIISGLTEENINEPLENIQKIVKKHFAKEMKILEERKKNQLSFNLFTIVNPILKSFGQKELEQRCCKNCKEVGFCLINTHCCESFCCIVCFRKDLSERNPKCKYCHSIYLCKDRKEFKDTYLDVYVAFYNRVNFKINEEVVVGLIQKINKINIKKGVQYVQFAKLIPEIMCNYYDWTIQKKAEPENLNALQKFYAMIPSNEEVCIFVATEIPHFAFYLYSYPNEDPFSLMQWTAWNSLFALSIVNFCVPGPLAKRSKMNRFYKIMTESVLSSFNFHMAYNRGGIHFHENNYLTLWIFLFALPLFLFKIALKGESIF